MRHADRERADARSEPVERAHRHAESVVGLPQQVRGRNLNAVEGEPADGVAREQLDRLAGEPRAVGGDDERRDALRARVGRGPGEHHVDVGVGRVRDPRLDAGEPVAGPGVAGRGELDRARVGPVLGLRQGEGGHRLAVRDRRHPAIGHLGPRALLDRHAAQALHRERGLRREDRPVEGGDLLEERRGPHLIEDAGPIVAARPIGAESHGHPGPQHRRDIGDSVAEEHVAGGAVGQLGAARAHEGDLLLGQPDAVDRHHPF